MVDNDNIHEKRGSYKRYLQNNSIPIPASTSRSRTLRIRIDDEIELKESSPESSADLVTDENMSEGNLSVYACSEDDRENNDLDDSKNDSDRSISDTNHGFNNSYECSESTDDLDNPESQCEDENSIDNGELFFNEIPFYESEDDDAMDCSIQEDSQLYDGCEINRKESELLIMSNALRHNFTDKALEDQLSLIDCHLPHSEYRSKYRFLQSFKYPNYLEYYYCPTCSVMIKFEYETAVCEQCDTNYTKAKMKEMGHYFIYIKLKDQLINLVKSKVYLHFRKISQDENDIINGSDYMQMRQNNVIKDSDITLTWNTDGVSLCKSSKFSMWPLQVIINELSYRIRRTNIILCGLFYGTKKPPMNLFLEPFQKELVELAEIGFNTKTFLHNEPINIKVHTILCSVDSVARPIIQNVKQYNGKYGCSYCLQKGEHIPVGRGFSRIYSYKRNVTQRTRIAHEEMVITAIEKNVVIKGVKGPSVMSLVPYLDIINSYPPEYMHACLLGVTKLFGTEWFNSANNSENWYLGPKAKEFDERMMSIKPPCEITRTPQTIIDNKYKASDWKNCLLYYSLPCLKNIMLSKYFKHWFLFVYSITIFLKSTITDDEFKLASSSIKKFVKDTEKLYGPKFMKYNVHVLLHLPTFIRNYGALWAWSAFPFEHYNGVLKQLHHGTQFIPQQICKQYSRLRCIHQKSSIFNNPGCSQRAQNLFTKLMNECRVKKCIEYTDDLKIFGKPKNVQLSMTEQVVIYNELNEDILAAAKKFQRFIYKNVLFHTCDYKRLTKRNNSYIVIDNNSLISITGLLRIKCKVSQDSKYVVLGQKLTMLTDNLCKYHNFQSSAFSFIAKESSSITCCKLSSVKRKCVVVPYVDEKLCILPLANTVEID